MSVFISYNRNDEDFVERLSRELIRQNIPVWRDKWQIGLGDSITQSIQDALDKASFVCLVLSNNALKSKWVEREITASLVKEIEEDRLSILPLVIDDCKLPLFLRDKLYADFRRDFDAGLRMILNAVGDRYNLFAGRFTNERKSTSFGTDILTYKESLQISLDIISEDDDHDYFMLTKVILTGNKNSLEQFRLHQADGEGGDFVRDIIGVCSRIPDIANARVMVRGNVPARESFNLNSGETNLAFQVDVTSKKVGEDDGKNVCLNLGALFQFCSNHPRNA